MRESFFNATEQVATNILLRFIVKTKGTLVCHKSEIWFQKFTLDLLRIALQLVKLASPNNSNIIVSAYHSIIIGIEFWYKVIFLHVESETETQSTLIGWNYGLTFLEEVSICSASQLGNTEVFNICSSLSSSSSLVRSCRFDDDTIVDNRDVTLIPL